MENHGKIMEFDSGKLLGTLPLGRPTDQKSAAKLQQCYDFVLSVSVTS